MEPVSYSPTGSPAGRFDSRFVTDGLRADSVYAGRLSLSLGSQGPRFSIVSSAACAAPMALVGSRLALMCWIQVSTST